MQNPNEIIVIVDQVEDDVWDGKPYKRIVTKAGESYKIGRNLQPKWESLVHGAALQLIMDVYKGNTYVKDFNKCYDLTQEKMAELSQPAPKNPRDASIERQVAVKCVVDLMCAAYKELPDDIKSLTLEWLRNAIAAKENTK